MPYINFSISQHISNEVTFKNSDDRIEKVAENCCVVASVHVDVCQNIFQ